MKLLLTLASDETFNNLSLFLKPLGFDLIRYRSILKAMDNIDEIDPAGIILSARDFPRHWKTMVQFVRAARPKESCPVLLLRGEIFPEDENAKAAHLGVNGVVSESLDDPAGEEKLRGILSGRGSVADGPQTGDAEHKNGAFGFMFSHPFNEKIITGTVTAVSSSSLSLELDHPLLIEDLAVDTEIPGCSLRAGGSILSPSCALRQTGNVIALDFVSFPEAEKAVFDACLDNAG
jgi:hypothetical protein